MHDLQISDGVGNIFELQLGEDRVDLSGDYPRAVLEASGAVEIDTDSASEMIDWLRERFGLEQPLERAGGFGQSVTITVPGAAGGESRTVEWMGDEGAPEWLQALASIALGAAAPQEQQNDYYMQKLMALRTLLDERRSHDNPQGSTVEARVVDLLDHDDLATERAERNYQSWKTLATALGAETTGDALAAANRLRQMLTAQGVTIAGPATLDKALGQLLSNHGAALAKQTNYWCEREQSLISRCTRDREAAVAREREARGALQVQHDAAMEQARQLKVALIGAQTKLTETLETLAADREELAALRAAHDEHQESAKLMRNALETVRDAIKGNEDNTDDGDTNLRAVAVSRMLNTIDIALRA